MTSLRMRGAERPALVERAILLAPPESTCDRMAQTSELRLQPSSLAMHSSSGTKRL